MNTTFHKRTDARIELVLEYHLDNGPTRQYQNQTSSYTVSNVRVWMRPSGDWQVILSGDDTVTGESIGEGQIVGDDVALANRKTMRWLRPIIDDAEARFAAARDGADR